MANNTELITGRGEDAHISSFDMRAFNRAVFGTGKYIFTDAENMKLEVDTVSKLFFIKSGSCMWSGMHVRIEGEESVSFVSPAATSNVYLWLHYKRNASTQVETVGFVSTTSSKVNSSLIYDELPDDVTEAYTLFATIEYDAANNVVRTTANEFELVAGMSDFYKETTQRLAAQSAEISDKVTNLETNLNTTLENYEGTIVDAAYEKFVLSEAKLSTSGEDYPLNHYFYDFKALVFKIGNIQYVWYAPFTKAAVEDIYIPLEINFGTDYVIIRKLEIRLYYNVIRYVKCHGVKIYRDTLGTYFENVNTFNEEVKIYGIGKD